MENITELVHLYAISRVAAIEQTEAWKNHCEKLDSRRDPPCDELPLIEAIREASRAAHRWRDAAARYYAAANYGHASMAKRRKTWFYSLKDRGIAAAYTRIELRYIGASPQGMAIYEYGEGGKQSFHSTLHPANVERPVVEGHPEILLVEAKSLGHLMREVEYTLGGLPMPGPEFERSAQPSHPRETVICYNCGEEGHIARECRGVCDPRDEWGLDELAQAG